MSLKEQSTKFREFLPFLIGAICILCLFLFAMLYAKMNSDAGQCYANPVKYIETKTTGQNVTCTCWNAKGGSITFGNGNASFIQTAPK